MKSQSYMTRALRARDPRFATILGKLGYERADMRAVEAKPKRETPAQPAPVDDIKALRDQYHDVLGKRAYHGWDAETLKAKIAEAKG